jgi:fumigallin biosynthesis monooxygenase-like protein
MYMGHILAERMCVQIEGDFVVFLIGMRVNKLWKLHKWLPVAKAMPRMIEELMQRKEDGFLGAQRLGMLTLVQYWRSFDALEKYARASDREHWPAWVAFNKRMGRSRGDVGIWHETYRVSAGEYEAIYSGMPPHGLGAVGQLIPARERLESARGRIKPHEASPAV